MKRTRKTFKLSQLRATNFARICIDVHVQVLQDRVVAKLAKLLSRWRTSVIQDGAEFCIRRSVETGQKTKNSFLTDDLVSLFPMTFRDNCVPLPQMDNQRRKEETDQVR